MDSETQSGSIRWPRIILVVVILFGIFFRFSGLESKIYWHDEAYTSLWISGHELPEVKDALFDGQIHTIGEIQIYQQLDPDSSVIDTIELLAKYDTQHPPLYYTIVRLWVDLFGDSITSIRFISVLLSSLALPCAYWLGLELFRSSLAAAILTGIIAISPFHVLYAQEAREYGLWTATILFSHAALIRSIQKPSNQSWALYILSLVLGLYTFLFTVLVMICHGLYVLFTQGFRITKTVKDYSYATLIGSLFFAPWIWELFTSADPIKAAGWTSRVIPLSVLIQSWGVNISRLFFDVNLNANSIVLGLMAILLGYCLFYLWNSPIQIKSFILISAAIPALFLILPDLAVGGIRSFTSRYLIPTWLSIQLMVAYGIHSILEAKGSVHILIQRVLILFLVLGGVLSCAAIPGEDNWWIKGISTHQPITFELIHHSRQPLVISDYSELNLGEILSMSHRLDPKVRLLLLPDPELPRVPEGFSDLFLFNPSRPLRTQLEAEEIPLEQVSEAGNLWRIDPR